MQRSLIEQKKLLREKALADLAKYPVSMRLQSDRQIFDSLISSNPYKSSRVLFVYYSRSPEPDTHELIDHALQLGKTVTVPFISGGCMQARGIKSRDELTGCFHGIAQPSPCCPLVLPTDLDLAVIPALLFDRLGYRLGRGGGYYDRYLPASPAIRLGLCRSFMLMDELPHETHDAVLEGIVTENGLVMFG